MESVHSFLDFAKRNYRVDISRIYLTGLSMGGIISCNAGGNYAAQIAAIVPVAGESNNDESDEFIEKKCQKIAFGTLPTWVLHNRNDPKVPSSMATRFVSLINKYNSNLPCKLTLFEDTTHDAWTKSMNPAYKENNMNVYEWMLQFSR